jgi:hypothetical protein
MSRSPGYDYNHATSGHQFLAIIIVVLVLGLAGLALALSIMGNFFA